MASTDNARLVWLDAEMTGLDLQSDELIEVAVLITDYNLTVLDEGFHRVIAPSAKALEQMGDFVRQMHTSSGLLDELAGGISLEQAQSELMDYLRSHVPEPQSAPLAGNTIGTDRAFIQRDMPEVNAHLHYRNIDVSTIKELTRHWFPRMYFQAPEKNGGHRALADIRESIRELAYYRQVAFVDEPGPSTSEIKKISQEIVTRFE
ncbi:oligoribonuclease [Pontimonas salivibrio]|uniref:Oligoribonuclease n=1 Tax=Pontimonas salivibrio TaxID=1159327 RepID=A0A2L2BPQ6_9MICO|nr:oligoribonuclease [Pontimonas salivibrio]AVG23645.1 oligoribonuclease [Pontimonas salivibrio]